jgi:DNA-binding LacI/PurR family transcriptional regulator
MTHVKQTPGKRATIDDIARIAGVSKATASAALNDRPGVAEATRQRVKSAAQDAGWQASSAARALSGTGTDTVGLLLDRPARTLGVEPFYMQLVSGIETALSTREIALLLQVVDTEEKEQKILRDWWAARRVDGVFLVDLREGDRRIALVEELGLPTVVIGGPVEESGESGEPGDGSVGGPGGVVAAWTDNRQPVESCLDYLYSLGHRRIAYVAGLAELLHTRTRVTSFHRHAAGLGLGPAEARVVHTDYSGEDGARATRTLLSGRPAPTAIIFDNDVMAVAGAAVTQEMRFAVPEQISLIAWDDSTLCTLVHPPLTALGRDVAAYGALSARLLMDRIDGARVEHVRADTPRLTVRGSTGPAPRE